MAAKRNRVEDEALKFEQTEGKSYGKKPFLDRGTRVKLTDISRPVPKRRTKPNKHSLDGEFVVKNKTTNSSSNPLKRLFLLTFKPFSFIIKSVKQMKGKHTMSKEETAEKKTPSKAKVTGWKRFRGIIGIGLAFVIVSIAYSSVVIWTGTEGLLPKIMLAPQAIFALVLLGVAFAKILK